MAQFSFLRWAFCGVLFLCATPQFCFGSNKLPERLRSPWDGVTITLTDAPWTCPEPPAFAKTIDAEGYYIDANHSIIDPVKKAAYEKADEGPVHLGQYAGLAADAYLAKGSRAAAACVYSLLDAAAKADAWAGTMPHNQGVYDQNWMLSGTAIPYLKVRGSGVGTPEQDAEIQKWFLHVAAQVRIYSRTNIFVRTAMHGTTMNTGRGWLWRRRELQEMTRARSSGAWRLIRSEWIQLNPTDR